MPPAFLKVYYAARSSGVSKNDKVSKIKVLELEELGPKTISLSVGRPAFSVPIHKLRYDGGLPYSYEHHHFLRYYKHGTSALEDFYQSHQPKNIFEKHFLPVPENYYTDFNDEEIYKTKSAMPWLYHINPELNNGVKGEWGLTIEHGNQAYGPVSNEKLALEARRLDEVLRSIKDNGFKPEEYDGYPEGYFLTHTNGDWVFLVRAGFHRVAALIHTGYTHIPFIFKRKFPRIVCHADCSEWPIVKEGLLTSQQASDIFRQYFR